MNNQWMISYIVIFFVSMVNSLLPPLLDIFNMWLYGKNI